MSRIGLLDDYLDLEPFAEQVGRHPRSVRRWMNQPDGLPFVRLGNRVLVHVPTAHEWLLGRMHYPNQRQASEARAGNEPDDERHENGR